MSKADLYEATSLAAGTTSGALIGEQLLPSEWATLEKAYLQIELAIQQVGLASGAALRLLPDAKDHPNVAQRWVKVATALRPMWAAMDKSTSPLTYAEVRLVWIRRLAYLLFLDIHKLTAEPLRAMERTALIPLLSFSPGRCWITEAEESVYLTYHNAGAPAWDIAGPPRLGTLFYLRVGKDEAPSSVADSFTTWELKRRTAEVGEVPRPFNWVRAMTRKPAAAFSSPQLSNGSVDIRRPETPAPLRQDPTSVPQKTDTRVYYSAAVWDTNPADYFEFIGNVATVFPEIGWVPARHRLGVMIEFLRLRGISHGPTPLSPQKVEEYDAKQKISKYITSKIGDEWRAFLTKDLKVTRPLADAVPVPGGGPAYDRAVSFRWAWARALGGCPVNSALLVSMARALGIPAYMARGGHHGTFFPSVRAGLAHGDDMLQGSYGFDVLNMEMLAADATLTPRAVFDGLHYGWSQGNLAASTLTDWLKPDRLVVALERSEVWLERQSDNQALSLAERRWYQGRWLRLRLAFRDDGLAAKRPLPTELKDLTSLVEPSLARASVAMMGAAALSTSVAIHNSIIAARFVQLWSALSLGKKIDISSNLAMATAIKSAADQLAKMSAVTPAQRTWGLTGWILFDLLSLVLADAKSEEYISIYGRASRVLTRMVVGSTVDESKLTAGYIWSPARQLQVAAETYWSNWTAYSSVYAIQQHRLWNAPLPEILMSILKDLSGPAPITRKWQPPPLSPT